MVPAPREHLGLLGSLLYKIKLWGKLISCVKKPWMLTILKYNQNANSVSLKNTRMMALTQFGGHLVTNLIPACFSVNDVKSFSP